VVDVEVLACLHQFHNGLELGASVRHVVQGGVAGAGDVESFGHGFWALYCSKVGVFEGFLR